MAVPLTQYFFESVLGCLSEGVIIIDSSDRIMIWNAALGSILHLDPSRALGQRYQDVFSIHPQLGLIGVLHSMRMQHPPGTMVRTSVEGSIPARGQIHLNLCIRLLANISQVYIGMLIVIDDRTERGRRYG